MIQVPEGHAVLRPKTFSDFLTAFGKALSWPWIDIPFCVSRTLESVFVLSYRIASAKKEPVKDPVFIMGLGLWTLLPVRRRGLCQRL